MQKQSRQQAVRPTGHSRSDKADFKRILAASGLQKQDLIFPVFVSGRQEVDTSFIPGISVSSVSDVVSHLEKNVVAAGMSKIILFGIPRTRDEKASSSLSNDGII